MTVFLAVSVLPSVALLVYIYNKDKADKEPFDLLLKLFFLGAVITFPIAGAESLLSNAFSSLFGDDSMLYRFAENFFVAGLCEEIGKFLVLYFVTRRNKNFNCLFDGVIYAVAVSLGFATLENILYVASYGISTGVVRAVTAVPGHTFFGITMGYFYTMWHLYKNLDIVENEYTIRGYIDQRIPEKVSYHTYIVLSLIAPILLHGQYDFLASGETTLSVIIFILFLAVLYFYSFKKVNDLSRKDKHEINIIASILNKKYPYLYPRIMQERYQQLKYNPYANHYFNPYSSQNNN